MSGLFSSLFGSNAGAPKVAGFRMQTAVYGVPIPILYGRARIAGNLIQLLDQKTGQAQAGGKAASKAGATQNTLQAAVVVGLCEGPIARIVNVWADKDGAISWSTLIGTSAWSLFTGTSTQAPWAYLTAHHVAQAVPYQLLAYVVNPLLDMPGGSLPSLSWEIDGFLPFGGVGGIVDAHPADVLVDFVTDTTHGMAIPATIFGDLSSYRDFCTAAGVFLSPAFTELRAGTDHLQELFQASYSAPIWSDGRLKVIPYADTAITGNGVTYTPNTTPLYDLNDDHFIYQEGQDPIAVTRKRPAERYNQVFVEYEARVVNSLPSYQPLVAEAKDQAQLELGIFRPAPKISLHAIKDDATARLIAQYLLQRELNVCNTYVFRLPWKFALLEPMDLVTLTDGTLGLHLTPVRITEIEEEDEGLLVTAEDWPFGTASATRYSTQIGAGSASNQGVAPGNTNTPVIFDSPGALETDPLNVCLAASGGASWGGCDVYISTDNVRFYKVGTITKAAVYGQLTASLAVGPALPAIDSTHTLSVSLTASNGSLTSGASSDVAALLTLCWVDGEFLSFQTATLTGANAYDLTNLGRGAYETIPKAHASSAKFARVDDAILQVPFPQGSEGQLLYVKLPAFNIYGKALQDLSTVPVFTHTIADVTNAIEMRVIQSEPAAGQVNADVYLADPNPTSDPIMVVATSFGTSLVAPQSAVLTYPTDPITDDLNTTDFVRFVIGQPAPGSPTGGVTFRATKTGRRSVTKSIDVRAQDTFTLPAPTIGPLTAEGTGVGGNAEGVIHIPLIFDVNTTEIRIYSAEAATAGIAQPDQSNITLSGIVTRQEGVIESSQTWATMFDISTTPGFYRKVVIVASGPAGSAQPFIQELQAVDTGTGPTAAPTAPVRTGSSVIVGGRAVSRETVTWTTGDSLAFCRVFRNGVIVAIEPPGTTTFVDDDVAPSREYNYGVDHYRNGQTSGAPVVIGTSSTPTLVPPTWVAGYPLGGVDSFDPTIATVQLVWHNPDPLARSIVYSSGGASDGAEPFPTIIDDTEPGISFTISSGPVAGTVRYFYVISRRAGYNDSVGSVHAVAIYGG